MPTDIEHTDSLPYNAIIIYKQIVSDNNKEIKMIVTYDFFASNIEVMVMKLKIQSR